MLNQINLVAKPVRKNCPKGAVCMGKAWAGRKNSNSVTPRFKLAYKWPKMHALLVLVSNVTTSGKCLD